MVYDRQSEPIGKVEDIQWHADGVKYYDLFRCRCYPFSTERQEKEYLFADLDHIRRFTFHEYDIETGLIRFVFNDGKVRIENAYSEKVITDILDSEGRLEGYDFLEFVHRNIADKYERMTIKEVLKMTQADFDNFKSMISRLGGAFNVEFGAPDEHSMVTIEIPLEQLNCLQIKNQMPELISKRFRFPEMYERIRDIQVFGEHAVEVTFADGSKTRSEVQGDDEFNLETGIAYCLFKKALGGGKEGNKAFNNLMRRAQRVMTEKEESKIKLQQLQEFTKRRAEKVRRNREKRKAKKREEQISIYAEAMRRAGNGTQDVDPEVFESNDEKFFDEISGITFMSNRSKINDAIAQVRRMIHENGYASVNDWCKVLGVNSLGYIGSVSGWDMNSIPFITFGPCTKPDGLYACTAIRFDHAPKLLEIQ